MKLSLVIAFAALLSACNNSDPTTKSSTSEPSATKSTPSNNDTKGSQITVTITGGANAGTYEASSTESTCSMGLTGDKSFGNQYSESGKGAKELSSVQLVADNYEEARKGTSNFSVMIGFGQLLGGTSYSINPAQNSGTGTLTISENGNTKIATVEGETTEGVVVKAVLTCKTIQKMVDGELKEE